jgi:thioredoxin 2
VRKVAEGLAGCAAVVTVNTQENPNLGARFGVRGIPALCLLRQGRLVEQISGAQAAETVLAWFRRHEHCR